MEIQVYSRLSRLRHWLLPAPCVLCGGKTITGGICEDCQGMLPSPGPTCFRCAAPLAGAPADAVCGRCQRRSPSFDRALAAFRYGPPVDGLIHALKYGHRLSHARILAELLHGKLLKSSIAKPDCLMPVPLHSSRLRERGFNQTLEIARTLSRLMDIPIDYRSVRRLRNTPAQTGLDLKARRRNVRNVFRVDGDMSDRSIAIIDDVMTSGATAQELARVLMRAGAATVQVWVVARAAY